MKISLEWLTEFVTWIETDPHKIAERLTLSTAEVEEVEIQGAFLESCCVGKVLSVAKHPNADRLLVAQVETDRGIKRVVCGGTNVHGGMQVAFAHIGATVRWHGDEVVKLQPVTIRGEQSEGMICAAEELDLQEMFPSRPEDGERPIIDLGRLGARSPKPKTGVPLREALGLTDTILHINNTAITARPDLFSHLGFARECIALGLAHWKKKPAFSLPTFPDDAPGIAMKVDVKDLVPRYLACTLSITDTGETPAWMKRRLEATGWRSISLPVDITNYVSMEIGVPLHSFDTDDLRGDVHLRLSEKGERITTLDEAERELPDGAMVLSDDTGIFDLVGIMGGLRSSTKQSTRKIYLHAASLDPATIRHAIIATGHRTDAATVYEKGVPPIVTEWGFVRALKLFLELVPGATITSALDSKGGNGIPVSIPLSLDAVRGALGLDIPGKDIRDILEDLGCSVRKGRSRGDWSVIPPLWRLRDLTGVHDLVEEIGRIKGFDAVPASMPVAPLRLPKREQRIHRVRDGLKEQGYMEIVPLSFVNSAMLGACGLPVDEAVAIKNPLGAETKLLQTTTLPRLLVHATENITRTNDDLRTFQWSQVFAKEKPGRLEMGLLLAAKEETDLLTDPFLRLKQETLTALGDSGFPCSVVKTAEPPSFAHPGRCADILLGKRTVGRVFEIHPVVRARFDLPHRAAAALLDVEMLTAHASAPALAHSVPAFPAVEYDVTVERTLGEPLENLLQKLRGSHALLEKIAVRDLFAGNKLGKDRYNLTLRFTYRSKERTLTEDEAKAAHETVLASAGIREA